jgi:hypothetical protein
METITPENGITPGTSSGLPGKKYVAPRRRVDIPTNAPKPTKKVCAPSTTEWLNSKCSTRLILVDIFSSFKVFSTLIPFYHKTKSRQMRGIDGFGRFPIRESADSQDMRESGLPRIQVQLQAKAKT